MNENPFADWADQVTRYQQSYLDAWKALIPDTGEATAAKTQAGGNPWLDALVNWWQAQAKETPPAAEDVFQRLVGQSKAYLQIVETFSEFLQSSQSSVAQWQHMTEQAADTLRQAFAHSAWELPAENWQHVMSSLSVWPGDLFAGINTESAASLGERMRGGIDQFLSTPGVGHMRERHEKFQQMAKLTLDYQQALQDYYCAHAEMAGLSVRRMQQRLTERAGDENEKPLASYKELYDFWVNCCEEVYAEYVMTEKYVAVHGHLVNALMAMKKHGRLIVDEALGALNMPTRSEMDTLHSRFHDVWRAEKQQHRQLEQLRFELEGLIERQSDQIAALRSELAALKQASAPKPPSAPKTSPTAPKRTAKRKSVDQNPEA